MWETDWREAGFLYGFGPENEDAEVAVFQDNYGELSDFTDKWLGPDRMPYEYDFIPDRFFDIYSTNSNAREAREFAGRDDLNWVAECWEETCDWPEGD